MMSPDQHTKSWSGTSHPLRQTPVSDPPLSPAALAFAKELKWELSDKEPEDEMTSPAVRATKVELNQI